MSKVRVIGKLLGIKGLFLFALRRIGIYYSHELKSLFKIIDWSIKSGFDLGFEKGLLRMDWISNNVIYPVYLRPYSSDPQVFKQIIIDRELEPIVHFFHEKVIKPLQMIDGGGNIGLATLFIYTHFPGLKCHIIEPNAWNVEVLKRNLPGEFIHLDPKALWSKEGWVYPLNESSEWGFSVGSLKTSTGSKAIPAITLSGLLEQYKESRIDYLKLDIEGAEEELFYMDLLLPDLLKNVRCISVEPHSVEFESFLQGYLEALGFKVIKAGELVIAFNMKN